MKQLNQKTKGLKGLLIILSLFFSLIFIYADTDINVDGGSGGYHQGNKNNYWNDHQGVRVSIYDKTGKKFGTTFDYSNNKPTLDFYYSQTSKLEYFKGASLTLIRGDYNHKIPKKPLPQVINTNMSGGGDIQRIQELKEYFKDVYMIQNVFDDAGVGYLYTWNDAEPQTKEKIDKFHASIKDYKIVFEPVAYFKHKGVWWGMSATEAGLHPDQAGLKQYLKRLTHQNLPLAIYLEKEDLGVNAWSGAKSGIQSTKDVVDYLGIGVISFDDAPKIKPKEVKVDYIYHTDTWVITSFDFEAKKDYGGDSSGAAFTASFSNPNLSPIKIDGVVVPSEQTQRVWFHWKTPSTPQDLVIKITGDTTGNILVKIVEDEEKTPPDAKPHDRYDDFKQDFALSKTNHLVTNHVSNSWSLYETDWVSETYKNDPKGTIDPKTGKVKRIIDQYGYYKFIRKDYSVRLEAQPEVLPSELTPTADGKMMKSGYGLNANIKVEISNNSPHPSTSAEYTNGVNYCIKPQKVKAWFPEFLYQSYNRILEVNPQDSDYFIFKKNKYSQEFHVTNNEKSRIHFTPIWYPNMDYPVKFEVYDAFTPAGQLTLLIEDKLEIFGNMYQDWHMGPTSEERN